MRHPLKASVIVVSHDRRALLAPLLADLERQSLPRWQFEVIIVDDGSADGTWPFLERFQRSSPLSVQIVRQEKRCGPSSARNRGAGQARGRTLVFVDSDCEAPPEWLENLVRPLMRPEVILAGGPELPHPGDSFLSKCFWFTMNSKLTSGGIRGSRAGGLGRYYPRSFNMAVSADVFHAIRGFRRTPALYGEDIEFSFLVRRLGGDVEFVESAPVYHRKAAGFGAFARQVFRMGKARFWLRWKYPALAEPVYYLPSLWLLLAASLWAAILSGYRPLGMLGGMLLLTAPFASSGVTACLRFHTPLAFLPVFAAGIVQTGGYGLGFLAAAISRRSRTIPE